MLSSILNSRKNFRRGLLSKSTALLMSGLILMVTNVQANDGVTHEVNELPIYQGVGGDFSLDSTLGKSMALSDFNNKTVVLSFGYTNCSDVCPVTLGFINNVLAELGNEAKKVQVLFVSVDPDYDTIKHLKKYLAYFNKDFIGMTGSKTDIDKAVKLYNIRYSKTSNIQVSTQYRKKHIPKDIEKSPLKDTKKQDKQGSSHKMHHGMKHGLEHNMAEMQHDTSALFSHSTYIYVVDTNGRVRGVFDTTTPASKMANSIQSLINSRSL